MNRLDNLTLRTTTALGRLASLQRRADKMSTSPSLLRDALEELNTALEELRVANETMMDQASEMIPARNRSDDSRRELEAIFSAMPTPCVITGGDGTIVEANPAASALLNVGRQHLAAKSLFLFFMDRQRLIDAVTSPPEGEFRETLVLRPRERRARQVLLRGVRLPDGQRWCWFLESPPEVPRAGSE